MSMYSRYTQGPSHMLGCHVKIKGGFVALGMAFVDSEEFGPGTSPIFVWSEIVRLKRTVDEYCMYILMYDENFSHLNIIL